MQTPAAFGKGPARILGSPACRRGKHERAAECFRAALALRSGEARTLFKLGNACFALQRFAAAEDAFEQALRARAPSPSHSSLADDTMLSQGPGARHMSSRRPGAGCSMQRAHHCLQGHRPLLLNGRKVTDQQSV